MVEGTRLVQLRNMHHARMWHTLTVVCVREGSQLKQKLFAIGSHPYETSEEAGKSAEMYDVCQGSWSLKQSLNAARREHSAVALGNSLFIIGGIKINSYTKDIEEYAIASDTWTTLSVKHPRYIVNQGVCAVNATQILLFGG